MTPNPPTVHPEDNPERPAAMLPRQRVEAALDFRPPDVVPLRIYPAPGGLYEHGRKLLDLIKACGHDFGDLSGLELPAPPPESDFDPDGTYHAFRTDAWGTKWEYRTFGVWGVPVEYPLDDLTHIDEYRTPPTPTCDGKIVERHREALAKARETTYIIGNGGSIFEKLHSLRRFEDVLVDIAMGVPEIHRVTNMLVEYAAAHVEHSLALGVDAVAFGDDFGTQQTLLMSPETWRQFFKPRYRTLFAPVKAAGKKVFFHCCGQVEELLEDFRDMGVDVLWPQLPAFQAHELARRCRDLGLVLELHPDRGNLMQRGSPDEIRTYVLRLVETFRTASGGSWLYLEIDPGFPWPNVETLFHTVMSLRANAKEPSR